MPMKVFKARLHRALGLVKGVPARGRWVETRWSLRSFPILTIPLSHFISTLQHEKIVYTTIDVASQTHELIDLPMSS